MVGTWLIEAKETAIRREKCAEKITRKKSRVLEVEDQ